MVAKKISKVKKNKKVFNKLAQKKNKGKSFKDVKKIKKINKIKSGKKLIKKLAKKKVTAKKNV